ncbi:hypothetical protein Peur_020584 [Populus x canadensis]
MKLMLMLRRGLHIEAMVNHFVGDQILYGKLQEESEDIQLNFKNYHCFFSLYDLCYGMNCHSLSMYKGENLTKQGVIFPLKLYPYPLEDSAEHSEYGLWISTEMKAPVVLSRNKFNEQI